MGTTAMTPKLIKAFENVTLPKAEWSHNAHLKVGLWYVLNFAFDDAAEKMRKNVRRYNESVGTLNTDASGYHETITIFWLIMIRQFVNETDEGHFDELFTLLLDSHYANATLPLHYYSKAYLMSATARKTWADPDLKPLPA